MLINPLSKVYQKLGAEFVQMARPNTTIKNSKAWATLISKINNTNKEMASSVVKELKDLKLEGHAVRRFAASEKFGAFKKAGLSFAAIGIISKPLSKLDIEAARQEKIKPEEKLNNHTFKGLLKKYQELSSTDASAKGRITPERQISLTPTLESLQILNKYVKVIDGNNSPRWDRKELTPDELEKSFVFKQPQSPYTFWE